MASQRGHFFQRPSGTVDFLLSPSEVEIEGNILSIQLNTLPCSQPFFPQENNIQSESIALRASPMTAQQFGSSGFSGAPPDSLAICSTSALPIMIPSDTDAMALALLESLIPKPTTTGRSVS